jgi:hypothetical protein
MWILVEGKKEDDEALVVSAGTEDNRNKAQQT